MVVGIVTVKDLLYLVQTVRADLSGIRAEIEDCEIDACKEHEEYNKPDPGLAGLAFFSKFDLGENVLNKKENIDKYDE